MDLKINKADLSFILIANLIIFQNPIMQFIPIAKYIDEVLTLFYAWVIVLNFSKFKRDWIRLFIILLIITILGIVGNFTSGISRSITIIALDILYFSKLFICAVGANCYFKRRILSEKSIGILAKELSLLIWIGVVCYICSYFANINMTYGVRYGIKCFKYIYSSPGMLSQYCILFFLIFIIDLSRGVTRKRVFRIILCSLFWVSTGRTRSIAIIASFIMLSIIMNNKIFSAQLPLKKKLRTLFNPIYVIGLLITIAFIGWDQVQHYFGAESTAARSLLLKSGFQIMHDYFPFGTGFATFGTEMAAQNYSPLYYLYGINSHWALVEGGSELTDCFWPAVAAEFGIIGLIMMIFLIFLLFKMMVITARYDKYCLLACIIFILYLLICSTGTSIFTAYTTTCFIVIFIGLTSIFNDKRL